MFGVPVIVFVRPCAKSYDSAAALRVGRHHEWRDMAACSAAISCVRRTCHTHVSEVAPSSLCAKSPPAGTDSLAAAPPCVLTTVLASLLRGEFTAVAAVARCAGGSACMVDHTFTYLLFVLCHMFVFHVLAYPLWVLHGIPSSIHVLRPLWVARCSRRVSRSRPLWVARRPLP